MGNVLASVNTTLVAPHWGAQSSRESSTVYGAVEIALYREVAKLHPIAAFSLMTAHPRQSPGWYWACTPENCNQEDWWFEKATIVLCLTSTNELVWGIWKKYDNPPNRECRAQICAEMNLLTGQQAIGAFNWPSYLDTRGYHARTVFADPPASFNELWGEPEVGCNKGSPIRVTAIRAAVTVEEAIAAREAKKADNRRREAAKRRAEKAKEWTKYRAAVAERRWQKDPVYNTLITESNRKSALEDLHIPYLKNKINTAERSFQELRDKAIQSSTCVLAREEQLAQIALLVSAQERLSAMNTEHADVSSNYHRLMRQRNVINWIHNPSEYRVLQDQVLAMGTKMDQLAARQKPTQDEVSRLTQAAMKLPLYLEQELEKITQKLADLTVELTDSTAKYEAACVASEAARAAWNDMRARLLREEPIAEAAAQTRLARWIRQKLAARRAIAGGAGAGGN